MGQAVLILIKPDGLKKSLTGNILTRLSETKLEIVAAKIARVSRGLAEEHYKHLKDKPFFGDLIKYLHPLNLTPAQGNSLLHALLLRGDILPWPLEGTSLLG